MVLFVGFDSLREALGRLGVRSRLAGCGHGVQGNLGALEESGDDILNVVKNDLGL